MLLKSLVSLYKISNNLCPFGVLLLLYRVRETEPLYILTFFMVSFLDLILYQWYLLLLLYNLKCKLCTLSLHISMNGVCPPNYRLRLFWNKSASFYLNSRCDLPPFWTTSINSPIIKVTIEYTLYNECLSILSNVYCFFK